MRIIKEAVYTGNLGFMEFHKFNKMASPEQKILFKQLLHDKQYVQLKKLLATVINVELDDSFYKGSVKESAGGRYRVEPLGVSYDDVVHALVVATRRENLGSKVIDLKTNEEIPLETLKKYVPTKPRRERSENLSLF